MKIREHIQGGDGSLDLNFEHNGNTFGGFVEWRSEGKADAVVIRDGSYAIARDFAIGDVEAAVKAAADTLMSDETDDALLEQPQITEVSDFGEEVLVPVTDKPLDARGEDPDEYQDNDDVGDDQKVKPGRRRHRRNSAAETDDKILPRS